MMCGQSYSDTSRLVADHIKPHKGDYELFTSLDNLQCLCKTCHDAAKQSQDRTGLIRGCDVNGQPRDHNHPWTAKGSQGGE